MDKKISFNEEKYGDWHLGYGDEHRIRTIVSLAGRNKKVLDIGCGLGEIGSRLIQNSNTVYGIDISPSAVKKANKIGLIAKVCDIEEQNIPFPNGTFDVVIAAEIIEHVFDTDAFLEKIKKVLSPQGELILSTPNIATLGRRILLLLGKNPLIEVNVHRHSAGHIRYFVKDTLIELLENHDMSVDIFTSDVINFTESGNISTTYLARMFPTFGKTLIIKAKRSR